MFPQWHLPSIRMMVAPSSPAPDAPRLLSAFFSSASLLPSWDEQRPYRYRHEITSEFRSVTGVGLALGIRRVAAAPVNRLAANTGTSDRRRMTSPR